MNLKSMGARGARGRERGYTFTEILIVAGVIIALAAAAIFFFTQQGQGAEYRQVADNVVRVLQSEQRMIAAGLRQGTLSDAAAARLISSALQGSPVLGDNVVAAVNAAACDTGTTSGIRITSNPGNRVQDDNEAGSVQDAILNGIETMMGADALSTLFTGGETVAANNDDTLDDSHEADWDAGGGTPTLELNICLNDT